MRRVTSRRVTVPVACIRTHLIPHHHEQNCEHLFTPSSSHLSNLPCTSLDEERNSSTSPLLTRMLTTPAVSTCSSTLPHILSLIVLTWLLSYDKPPPYDVTIEDFETCALERLRILAEIESSFARNRSWNEMAAFIDVHCKKYYPLDSSTAKFVDVYSQRRRDHIGHYVLRLAFCRS